jgi:hypothetical protein
MALISLRHYTDLEAFLADPDRSVRRVGWQHAIDRLIHQLAFSTSDNIPKLDTNLLFFDDFGHPG